MSCHGFQWVPNSIDLMGHPVETAMELNWDARAPSLMKAAVCCIEYEPLEGPDWARPCSAPQLPGVYLAPDRPCDVQR